MKLNTARQLRRQLCGCGAVLLVASLLTACSADQEPRPGATSVPEVQAQDQSIGLVLTDFSFEQPPIDADVACPNGLNMNEFELAMSPFAPPELEIIQDMPPEAFLQKLRDAGAPDSCKDPTVYQDPSFRTMDITNTFAPGFDLRDSAPTAMTANCPSRRFTNPDGKTPVDNQLWRVLGCIKGYQRGDTIDDYAQTNIREGARTILLSISRPPNEEDPNAVDIGIFSSADPIPTDATGAILSRASLQISENPLHHNRVRGTLVNDIVNAGPFDLRLDFQGQFLKSEYHFRNAHLRLELLPDGGATGLLGGYWDIEAFYDAYGRQATRSGSFFVGFTCPGMYAALQQLADARSSPDSEKCDAISTTFRISAMPAFVIVPE